MPGLHYCEECWYYNEGKCDAKHGDVKPSDYACTDFASKNEED